MKHPTQEQLRQYIRGECEGNQLQRLETHLNLCNACDETVETLDAEEHAWIGQFNKDLLNQEHPEQRKVDLFVQRLLSADCLAKDIGDSSSSITAPQIRDYQLYERVGQGGMGEVFRAQHTRLGRQVAIKLVNPHKQKNEQTIARFQREMLAGGALAHPNIVQTTDAGEENGVYFLVMEYLHGVNLKELIVQHGRLRVADACEIVRQTANALAHAHERNLVHRDIKPSNIMLVQTEGETIVKVLDLGLARFHTNARLSDLSFEHASGQHAETSIDSSLTNAGQILGTLDYLSPEQARGETGDERSDIYSLGAALYQTLSGRTPHELAFYTDSREKLQHIATVAPHPLVEQINECPDALSQLVSRMMALNPGDRIQSMEEVADALASFTGGSNLPAVLAEEPAKTSPACEPKVSTRSQPKSRLRLVAGLVAGVLAVIAFAAVVVVETSKGTVTISGSRLDEDVTIVVSDNKKTVAVLSKKNDWNVRISEGVYDIQIKKGDDRFKIENGVVTVSRMGKEIVEISKNTTAKRNEVADKTSPDKIVCDWIRKVRSLNEDFFDHYLHGELPSTGKIGEWGTLRDEVPEEGVLIETLKYDSYHPPPESVAKAIANCRNLNNVQLKFPITAEFVAGFSKGKLAKAADFTISHRNSQPLTANQLSLVLTAIPNVETLDITGIIRGEKLYQSVASLKKLKVVRIRSAEGSQPATGDIQKLSSLPDLQQLTLATPRADQALFTEATNTTANIFSLEDAVLKPEDSVDVLKPLTTSGKFNNIHFSRIPNLTVEKLEVFRGNKQIEIIGFFSLPELTDEVIPIIESMPNLKRVYVRSPGTGFTSNGEEKLKQILADRIITYN